MSAEVIVRQGVLFVAIAIGLAACRGESAGTDAAALAPSETPAPAPVAPAPPSYAEELACSTAALASGELSRAISCAEAASLLEPSAPAPLEILAAIFDARKDAERARPIYARLAALPAGAAPKQAPEPSAPNLTAGSIAYVASSQLFVRAKPDKRGSVLTELAIHDGLRVDALEASGWARVSLRPEQLPVLELDFVTGAASAATSTLTGFVRAAYLSTRTASRDELVARSAALEKEHRLPEALVYLDRAAHLDPSLRNNVASLAVRAENYRLAASLAVPAEHEGATIALAYACRGDRRRAVWIDREEALARSDADLCVEGVDAGGPCGPPLPREWCYEPGPEQTPAEIAHEEALLDAEEEKAVRPRVRAWEVEHRAFTRAFAKFEQRFVKDPWLKLELSAADVAGEGSLFLFGQAYTSTTCDGPTIGRPIIHALPALQKRTLLWVHVPRYEGMIYGVERATDRETLARMLATPEPRPELKLATSAPSGCPCQQPERVNCY